MHSSAPAGPSAQPSDSTAAARGGVAWWLGEGPAKVLGLIACLALFTMMLITFFDVVGRYFLASPLPAAYELTSLIMPAIIFCALPQVNLSNSHVTIDLLDSITPAAVRRWQAGLVSLVAAAVLGVLAWRLWALSKDHLEFDGVTNELYLPLWPFSAAMSVLCVIAMVSMVVAGANHLAGRSAASGSAEL